MDDKLIDRLKKELELIKFLPFIKIDKRLKNKKTTTISISTTRDYSSIISFDYEKESISMIKSEINNFIYKEIVNKLSDTKEFDYLDIRNTGGFMSGDLVSSLIVDKILSTNDNKYSNSITCSSISSDIRDNNKFINTYRSLQTINGSKNTIFHQGKLDQCNIYTDLYMRYNEDMIILFNEVYINIENFDFKIILEPQFTPILMIKFDMSIESDNSKLLFIISSDDSPGLNKYKSLIRDKNIEIILDEKK